MPLEEIPKEALDHPISGVNLKGETLATEIGDSRVFLVFLRHLG